eukprot:7632785-Lingulodinium_polyedra.AAC.1
MTQQSLATHPRVRPTCGPRCDQESAEVRPTTADNQSSQCNQSSRAMTITIRAAMAITLSL